MRLLSWRWLAFALFVVAILAVMPGLKTAVRPDNALTVWFLKTDPQLQNYNRFQKHFGNDEVILIQIYHPQGIFNASLLQKIEQLSKELENVEGVDSVHSLLSARDFYETGKGLKFDYAVPRPLPSAQYELAALKKRLVANPLMIGRFISKDGTRAMLWAQMETMADIDLRRDAIVGQVRQITGQVMGETEHPMGGIGVIYSGLNIITQHDFGLFVGITYLVMFVAVWWFFKSLLLVAAILGVILTGTLGALGVYGLLDHQINMVTIVLPTLIIVLGIADAIHFPAIFFQELSKNQESSRGEIVYATVKRVFLPCLFTTITTICGFMALVSSPMAVIQHLGIYAALGVGIAFVASMIFMTLVFYKLKENSTQPRLLLASKILNKVDSWLREKPGQLAGLSVLLVLVALIFAFQVKTDTYTLGYFPDDHQVVKDHLTIEKGWGYYSPLEFTVVPARGLKADSPEILAATQKFVDRAKEMPLVSDGFGLYSIYRRMAQVMGAELKPDQVISAPLVAQLKLLLESEPLEWNRKGKKFQENFLAPVITQDGNLGRITLLGKMISAKTMAGLFKQLENLAKETMGKAGKLVISGYPPLYVSIIDYVTTSQVRSFFLALAIIFVLMLTWLRSLRLALISIVPNCFPVLFMLGAMGILGIDLDIGTATVGAIVLGISIDDTIHFLHYWQQAEKDGLSWEACLKRTFKRAGTAAIMTTLLLVIGYPVLMLADVATVFYFGLLTTVAALAAIYGDLVMLPLLLKVFAPKSPSGN